MKTGYSPTTMTPSSAQIAASVADKPDRPPTASVAAEPPAPGSPSDPATGEGTGLRLYYTGMARFLSGFSPGRKADVTDPR